MRGGGTSQAGQAIGAGVIVDTSKYLNRILELNVEERWARVEPGIVLDELNAQLKKHNLRFAPDISTASRATVGGMMANNSSGARSVLYGKTIDHVLEQEVVLSDGTVTHFRPLSRAELEAKCAGPGARGGLLSRGPATRRGSRRRNPSPLSQSAAPCRRLQPRRVRRYVEAVQPGEADGRVGGHARSRSRGEDQSGPSAEREGRARDSVCRPARSARRRRR